MGIAEDIQQIKTLLEDKQNVKEKKFKYPFGKKVGKSQKKKNYVTVFSPYENGFVDIKKYQIIDQTIVHDVIPRLATAGHVMHDKNGNPILILPNWSVEPFSPLEHYQKTLIDGSNTNGYKIIMARMESEKTDAKKKMGGVVKWIIGLGLAAIIIYAILSGGAS